jgi:hypothetical protein
LLVNVCNLSKLSLFNRMLSSTKHLCHVLQAVSVCKSTNFFYSLFECQVVVRV